MKAGFPGLMQWLLLRFLMVLLLAGLSGASMADVITLQGQLVDQQNTAFSGITSVKFSIYDASLEGTVLWTELHEVEAINGVFTVALGTIVPIEESLSGSPDRWLAMDVDGGGDQPRRIRLSSKPMAIHATKTEAVPPLSIDGSRFEAGAVSTDKLAPCNPGEIIAMSPQGWVCKVPGVDQ